MNYRLSPAVSHPEHVRDVARAFSWLKAHADAYGGDPDRVFIMGHSAGAHLVALMALDPQYLAEQGMAPDDVAGTIPLDTAKFDLSSRAQGRRRSDGSRTARDPVAQAFGRDLEALRAASPLFNVQAGLDYAPFLIVYAARRPLVTQQSEELAAALRDVGGVARTLAVPNKSHRTINRGQADPEDPVTRAVIDFVHSGE